MSQMIKKSYAKVNIFLKVADKRNNYHELVSRFVQVHDLFDIMSFVKTSRKGFSIIGNFSCDVKTNTVYKMYNLLKDYKNVEKFFQEYSVKIDKNIPEYAGLGGGSSNAATFLLMVNKYCNLNLSKEEMCTLAKKIGADVPFFIYEYKSANVTGIGEIVEKFDEEILDIEVVTPPIKCDTGKIFKIFREHFYKQINKEEAQKLMKMTSKDALKNMDISYANDLYQSAIYEYPHLKDYAKDSWYFSGSGSSFFRLRG